jgi:hypothetical protein
MHWDGYTVFSVLSGAVVGIGSLVGPKISAKDRIYGCLGGAFFVGYGLYAASQTSGTFVFPVWIFVVPALGVLYMVAKVLGNGHKTSAGPAYGVPHPPQGASAAGGPGKAALGGPAPRTITEVPGPPRRPDVWAPPPPPPSSPVAD